MSRAGKKRRAPITLAGQPNMVARLAAAEREARMSATILVLNQPHRRGNNATECASALGRLWLSLRIDDRTMVQAGEQYAGLVRRWRSAWGVAEWTTAPHEDGQGTGEGPSAATVRAWRADIDRIEARLTQASCAIRFAVNRLVLEDRDLTGPAIADARIGLHIVAIELGIASVKDHPYR